MKKKIKGILFDFNGTMVFDSPEHKKAWDVFSQKYRNCSIRDEEMDHMHGKTNKAIIDILLHGSVSQQESKQLSLDKEALYRKICKAEKEAYHLVEGLPILLDTLKEHGVPMTICSASIKENMDFFIDHFQLNRWFDLSHIVYDDGTHTNKITMFQEGATRIHIPIEDCLIFEDSLSGIQFARDVHAAGIIAITSPDKVNEYQKMSGIDHVICDYKTLDLFDLYDF